MSHVTDDVYAVVMEDTTVLHGSCAEKKWSEENQPSSAMPVYYGDAWRGEVAGMCSECGLFVDPSAP